MSLSKTVPLMENVLTSLGLTTAASGANAAIQIKILGLGIGTLII